MILEKTVKLLQHIYKYQKIIPPKISKVVIGLGYTGVELLAYAYDPFLGLASTLPSILKSIDCTKIEFAGSLTDKSFRELMNWSYQGFSLEKVIGIATLNAASQHILAIKNPYKEIREDLIDFLKINKQTRILFIGFMKPMIKSLLNMTRLIRIIEHNPLVAPSYHDIPILKDINELKESELETDILFCSGTTLINDTLETILSVFKNNAKTIIVVGPSVSFLPDILFDEGVNIVGGLNIIDSESTIKILQEGGGTKIFKKYGKKYNFTRNDIFKK
ncbi:MAG: Rossmann-like domain-containing protein [Promethearchaeota archaeon]